MLENIRIYRVDCEIPRMTGAIYARRGADIRLRISYKARICWQVYNKLRVTILISYFMFDKFNLGILFFK
jgi:hypothetical protein